MNENEAHAPATEKPCNGWVRLYHPCGVQVTLPVGCPFDYALAFNQVNGALAAGWLVTAPGLEAGEEKEEIGYCLKKLHKNKDGRPDTPLIDLYATHDKLVRPVYSHYLNTPEDIAAFETVTGINVAKMPRYIGSDKYERGKDSEIDAMMVRPKKPFTIILTKNPAFDEAKKDTEEMKFVRRRLFVRYDIAAPPKAVDANAGSQDAPVPVLETWPRQPAGKPTRFHVRAKQP